MEIGIKERVEYWARSGGDFSVGLSLFLTFNRNFFYVRNIEAKGVEKGLATLVCEFANKIKVSSKEIFALIEASQVGSDLVITPDDSPQQKVREEEIIQQKKTIKLREEFPFLGRKDCPEEFAILINKMLTAYDDYRSDRDKLYLSLIHISEPTRRTPISYAVFCLK